jgi:hypothetical protein
MIKKYYIELLPIFAPPTTFVGFITGMYTSIHSTTPLDMFSNWVGYTSIGMLTGVSYPVSFPMLAGYVIYKNY